MVECPHCGGKVADLSEFWPETNGAYRCLPCLTIFLLPKCPLKFIRIDIARSGDSDA